MANATEKKKMIEVELDEDTIKQLKLKLIREQKTVNLWVKEKIKEYLNE